MVYICVAEFVAYLQPRALSQPRHGRFKYQLQLYAALIFLAYVYTFKKQWIFSSTIRKPTTLVLARQ